MTKEEAVTPFNREVKCFMANGTVTEGYITGNSYEIAGVTFVEIQPKMPQSLLINLTRKYAWVHVNQLTVITHEEVNDVSKSLIDN